MSLLVIPSPLLRAAMVLRSEELRVLGMLLLAGKQMWFLLSSAGWSWMDTTAERQIGG
jgi:hypothetical protein